MKTYAFIIQRSKWSQVESGYANGYVAITKEHPLFGMSYSDEVEVDPNTVQFNGNYIGLFCAAGRENENMLSLDLAINVHGGLTYSRALTDKQREMCDWLGEIPTGHNENLWVFGFDTAHCDDNAETCDKDFCIAETLKLQQILQDWK